MKGMKKAGLVTAGVGVPVVAVLVLLLLGLLALIAIAFVPEEDNDPAAGAGGCLPTDDGGEGIPAEHRDLLDDAADEAGVPVSILAAQIDQESGWDPEVTSPVGAEGIAQFMPETWESYGDGGDVTDPADAIPAQGRFMADLMDEVSDLADDDDHQIELALAAYNAGPGAVQEHSGVPPFDETQDYVEVIPRNASNFSDQEASGDSEDQAEQASTTEGAGNCDDIDSLLASLDDGEWMHPLPGGELTSGWGPRSCPAGTDCNEYVSFHYGIDFSDGGGSEIVAMTDMEITDAGTNEYQGEYVIGKQTEDPGFVVQHHHCESGSTMVSTGDTVSRGDGLCLEGNTGNTSGGGSGGHHLHLQILTPDAPGDAPDYDDAIDPTPILREQGVL